MKRISNCTICSGKLTFTIIRNRKYWVYGTISFIGFIVSFVLIVLLKIIGLILGLLLNWYLWNWYTHKVDYIGFCTKCDR